MKIQNWIYSVSLFTLIAASSLAKAADEQAQMTASYEAALQAWERTLSTFVDDEGRTDFIALSSDPEDLRQFVAFIASTSPDSNPELFPTRNDVLAYHINAYNALAMLGVIDRDIPEDFDSFFKRASFFKFKSVVVGGEKTSLYDYENKVIRPLGEARSHFALNCMVRDCPRLPMEAFRGETLDEQLQAASLEFFSKPKHIVIDHEKERLYVSAILDFYTEDFVSSGQARDLHGYVNQFLPQPVPESYSVRFIEYDWTINQSP